MKKAISIFIVGLSFLSGASHANVACNGKLVSVGVSGDGSLTASTGNGVWTICNLNAGASTVTPAVCKAWAAQLISIKSNDGSATIFLTGDAPCASRGDWVQVPAYFVSQ